jgi:alpha-galactosidase
VALSIALSACGGTSEPPPEVDDDLPLPLVPGPAPTPPMGWSSWNGYSTHISDAIVRQTADVMVSSGMRDLGYVYVNIDDGWEAADRAADGSLQAGAGFPNGIAAVADYVHGLGMKLGIHNDRGNETCAMFPGTLGHAMQDAMNYAAWGVDYFKYDNCATEMNTNTIDQDYIEMGQDLTAATQTLGRTPIVYSICAWKFYEWSVGLGSLWRTSADIRPAWTTTEPNAAGVADILVNNQGLGAYAGPNGWNDPDMLEVGNTSAYAGVPSLTDTEQVSHFTMWAISASPLIAGTNLVSMTDATKNILTNAEIIAIDQDAMGLQGAMVSHQVVTATGMEKDVSIWAKPLNESGARAVVLLNSGPTPQDITVQFKDVGLRAGSAKVRDLWAHADRGSFSDKVTATAVPSHGVVAFKIVGSEPTKPKGTAFLSDLTWTYASNNLGPIEKDTNVGATAAGDGTPLTIRGAAYTKGLGMGAPAAAIFRLAQNCSTFHAEVGVDDVTKGAGSVDFQVWADGVLLFDSGVVTGMSPVVPIDVSVVGVRRLKLLVTATPDGPSLDRADWGNASVDCAD